MLLTGLSRQICVHIWEIFSEKHDKDPKIKKKKLKYSVVLSHCVRCLQDFGQLDFLFYIDINHAIVDTFRQVQSQEQFSVLYLYRYLSNNKMCCSLAYYFIGVLHIITIMMPPTTRLYFLAFISPNARWNLFKGNSSHNISTVHLNDLTDYSLFQKF